MAKNKYTYYKVIQEYWNGWCDSDFYETDSTFFIRNKEDRARFKENLRLYRENAGCAIRVIKRKELNEEAV